MPKYIDIHALASEALSLVEEREKTAFVSEPEEELRTEIGRALKQAASYIRDHSDMEVTASDLDALKGQVAKVAALSPIPAPNPSAAGDRFRKLAERVRENGDVAAESRLIKAAQMINAAVAFEHLNKRANLMGGGLNPMASLGKGLNQMSGAAVGAATARSGQRMAGARMGAAQGPVGAQATNQLMRGGA